MPTSMQLEEYPGKQRSWSKQDRTKDSSTICSEITDTETETDKPIYDRKESRSTNIQWYETKKKKHENWKSGKQQETRQQQEWEKGGEYPLRMQKTNLDKRHDYQPKRPKHTEDSSWPKKWRTKEQQVPRPRSYNAQRDWDKHQQWKMDVPRTTYPTRKDSRWKKPWISTPYDRIQQEKTEYWRRSGGWESRSEDEKNWNPKYGQTTNRRRSEEPDGEVKGVNDNTIHRITKKRIRPESRSPRKKEGLIERNKK